MAYGQADSQTVTQLLTRLDATSNHTSFLLRFDIDVYKRQE